jgi:hypothetical protein
MSRPLYRALLVAVGGACTMLSARAHAQTLSPSCAADPIQFQDACQKTTDVFDYLSPQLGTAMTGGNATPGQVGTVGGLGHFWLGLRGTGVSGTVPDFNKITVHPTGPTPDSLPTKSVPVPMAGADLAIGIFGGLPLGLTKVGGLDLLLNAFYVPTITTDKVDVRPNHSLKIGYGGRLGILKESGLIPGVAFTYVVRDLPTTTITATDASGDSLRLENLALNTTSWRVTVGKTLAIVGLVAGVGEDTYDAHTDVGAEVDGFSSGTTPLATPHQKLTRTNYFGDLSLNLAFFRIVGEFGGASGGSITTYNTFVGKAPSAARVYGSLGMGIKI